MRIGTRGSALALAQARQVAAMLLASGVADVEIVEVRTSGDRQMDRPLGEIAGIGVFTREIEEALLRVEVDVAVHSLKDLPTLLPETLVLAAVPKREDPRDVLITREGVLLSDLPTGSRVGTSSLRRSAQILALRPDLCCAEIRGNVPTRIKKLENGEYDAVVLALAGLRRLGLEGRATQILDPDQMLPAVGQGALGLEARAADAETRAALERLSDPDSLAAVTAERALLAALGGGCRLPIGAYGWIEGGRLVLDGCACSPDGARIVRASGESARGEAEALGREVGGKLLDQGAGALLEEEPSPNPGSMP